jgi:ComF family protein
MLTRILNFFHKSFDFLLPKRSDYEIVSNLKDETIYNLPKAREIEGFDWIHPLFSYKDNCVRAIIWELKYKNHTLPLGIIGKMLFDEIISLISDISTFDTVAKFLLIPIPITNSRRSERGYNQSEYISRAIIGEDAGRVLLYAPQWLSKTKETHTQSQSKSKQERIENLVNCFEANEEVSGKYIILIDDVVTTGSTLLEARKTLFSAGAKDVLAFTIAH